MELDLVPSYLLTPCEHVNLLLTTPLRAVKKFMSLVRQREQNQIYSKSTHFVITLNASLQLRFTSDSLSLFVQSTSSSWGAPFELHQLVQSINSCNNITIASAKQFTICSLSSRTSIPLSAVCIQRLTLSS